MIDIQAAIAHLSTDPIMTKLIQTQSAPTWRNTSTIDVFSDVIAAIISQQLSVKVADVIEERMRKLISQSNFTPHAIASLDIELMRASGVSYAKIKYMKAAADAALSGKIDFNQLTHKTDEEIIKELTQIHGIGRWTAEMLLISSLQRPDVFSLGDLGLRTAVSRLYEVERTDLEEISKISLQWSPHRTVASKYLWGSLNNAPII